MSNNLDQASVSFALKRVISELDYDLHKSLENPEDEDGDTYLDMIYMFIEAYEENEEFRKNGQRSPDAPSA